MEGWMVAEICGLAWRVLWQVMRVSACVCGLMRGGGFSGVRRVVVRGRHVALFLLLCFSVFAASLLSVLF